MSIVVSVRRIVGWTGLSVSQSTLEYASLGHACGYCSPTSAVSTFSYRRFAPRMQIKSEVHIKIPERSQNRRQ